MAHTPRCMEVTGGVPTVILPNFGAQKPFEAGLVTAWAQIRRRSAIWVQVAPSKLTFIETIGIVTVFDADDKELVTYVGARPQRILLPRQCTKVTVDSLQGGVMWLEDPHVLGPIRND